MAPLLFVSPLPLRPPRTMRLTTPTLTSKRPPRVPHHKQARQARRAWQTPHATTDKTEEETAVETTLIPELEALDPSSGAVTVPPSYTLPAGCVLLGGLLEYFGGGGGLVAGLPLTLLGFFLALQSMRVRFIFGPTRLSVAKRTGGADAELSLIRGWRCDQIVNWEIWWPAFPILAYFKESESYNGRGSVHFFPLVCDANVLIEQLVARTPHLDKSKYS